MDYAALWNEIDTDPTGRGYSGMSDASVAGNMNEVSASQLMEYIDPATLYNSVDDTEWDGLSSACQDEFYDIIHVGTTLGIQTGPGTRARQQVKQIFGVSSSTVENMVEAATEYVSRAMEIGLPTIKEGHVTKVRSYYGG